MRLSLLSALGFLYLSPVLGLSINHLPISAASAGIRFFNNLQIPLPLSKFPPPPCTTSSQDLSSLVSCHVSLVLRRELNPDTYASIQPTDLQRQAWLETISTLLDVHGDCSTISRNLPEPLTEFYTVLEVGEFCALVETSTVYNFATNKYEYEKGWGIFVVPSRKDYVMNRLHFSAPYPTDDLLTGVQAGYIFEKRGAKSLYIAGRKKGAFRMQTSCVASIPPYWKTDSVHDNEEMMLDTYNVIRNWQNAEGCNTDSCAYVQLLGKGDKTCPTDQAFISSGFGRDPQSLWWYNNPLHANLPVHRLARQFTSHFPTWNATLPSSSDCSLTGTKNIVGRLINDVPETVICTDAAMPEPMSGAFVHIVQSPETRWSEHWDTWVEVFRDSFHDIRSELS